MASESFCTSEARAISEKGNGTGNGMGNGMGSGNGNVIQYMK